MLRTIHVLRAGKLDYKKSIVLQKQITERIIQNEKYKNILILTEHDPVYTIGIRTKNYSLVDEMNLKNLGADFHKTDRGGLITFHGPGQLVAYPIINLKNFKPSMKWYISQIENTIIKLCNDYYNLKAQTCSDVGIWIDDRKICAIGVHGSRYITSHGLALNCNNDLSWFDHIVPCGIEGKGVTSLTNEMHQNVSIDTVTPNFLKCFSEIFESNIHELNDIELHDIMACIKTS